MLDPNIILSGTAGRAPVEGPIDQYAKAIQLKSLLQAQQQSQNEAPLRMQALQQNVQAGQQDIAAKQNAINDQQAQTAAMKEWDGKDPHMLPGLILKHGGSASAVMATGQQILAQQKTKSEMAKDDAVTGSTNFETAQKKNDALLGSLSTLSGVPDAQLHDAALGKIQEAVQGGLLDPQHGQQLAQNISGIQDPAQLRDQLKVVEKGLMGEKAQFDQAQKERETAASELKAKTEQDRLALEKQGVIGPAAGVDRRELNDWLARPENKGKDASDFAKFKAALAPQAQVNVQMGGSGKGGPLTDATIDALAAPGAKLKLADVLPPRAPLQVKQAAINQVLAKYPQFATSDYDIEKGVMKSGASGDIGKNLTTFNTAIEHSKQLQAAADALDNTDVRPLNKITNELGFQTGSDKQTNFNVVKSALAGEISKVFKGGQATDAEIKEVEKPFDDANSPAQLKGAIQQAIRLMNSKRDALKDQYDKGLKGQANFGDAGSSSTVTKPANHPFFESLGGQVRQQ